MPEAIFKAEQPGIISAAALRVLLKRLSMQSSEYSIAILKKACGLLISAGFVSKWGSFIHREDNARFSSELCLHLTHSKALFEHLCRKGSVVFIDGSDEISEFRNDPLCRHAVIEFFHCAELLIDRDLKKTEFAKGAGIGQNTLAKMGKVSV